MLILGGAAATGAIAIQLGKAVGAYVTTTVAWLQGMRGFRSLGVWGLGFRVQRLVSVIAWTKFGFGVTGA